VGPAYTTKDAKLFAGPGLIYRVKTRMPIFSQVRVTGPAKHGFYPVRYRLRDGWTPAGALAPGKAPTDIAVNDLGVDDYPYKGRRGIDPWRFYECTCTSFVAWRINHTLGIPFENFMRGHQWGNATDWHDAALA